ncbi:MAG: gfo/Idh/MocA family oxidoreductase [Chloroflexi bacterium HGW-Chloroflexi-1]|nr:MAG: gfo/Idh/MocA family oxidoreductase [Chloroflexi bacterium HGW-Chloroflexi-1]
MTERILRFGVIGCGLMAREFASATLRWPHLLDLDVRPRLVAVADTRPSSLCWFTDNLPDVTVAVSDYRELLASADVDAVYCAVPHHLHAQIYGDIIRAGKHLLGEKPFGIDLAANEEILATLREHPGVFARCSSEFPFFPGASQVVKFIREGRFGKIIEVEAGLWHSSDLDPAKPINWKRMIQFNGEYGCMGDLGMHPLHIPLRFGWMPKNVRALLSKIVTERPDGKGGSAACETWDNAILACEVETADQHFPMLISTKRIAPGEANTWFIKIIGMKFSAEFSTKYPRTLRTMTCRPGQPQSWEVFDLGHTPPYATITGSIFEFGFSDSILQMVAAFCDELTHGDQMRQPFGCATPEETHLHHRVLTAALESHKTNAVVKLCDR